MSQTTSQKVRIIGDRLATMPWQDKPAGAQGPVWRHDQNPVIGRNPVRDVARIFNSAVMAYENKFVGIFRAETVNGRPHLHLGWSDDAIDWDISEEAIPFVDENTQSFQPRYAYDPRLVKVEDTYYVIWCTDFHGAAIGMASTKDFK